jgi:prepilin-type N-terminal cleavage/methylation domain-containing protein
MNRIIRSNTSSGFSLLELLVVLAVVSLIVCLNTTDLLGAQRQRDFEQFAREMVALLETCRWKALNERSYAGAIVEEQENVRYVSLYLDGNGNGIRTADVQAGKDYRFRGPVRMEKGSQDIATGILNESIPELPPKKGFLNPDDPVQFGKSNIISFSPKGDSSSGTLYLACRSQQQMFAVVIYGATARLRLWKYSNHEWQMVEDS